jgi:hypothetical protein
MLVAASNSAIQNFTRSFRFSGQIMNFGSEPNYFLTLADISSGPKTNIHPNPGSELGSPRRRLTADRRRFDRKTESLTQIPAERKANRWPNCLCVWIGELAHTWRFPPAGIGFCSRNADMQNEKGVLCVEGIES